MPKQADRVTIKVSMPDDFASFLEAIRGVGYIDRILDKDIVVTILAESGETAFDLGMQVAELGHTLNTMTMDNIIIRAIEVIENGA
jgi:hypothetical protein